MKYFLVDAWLLYLYMPHIVTRLGDGQAARSLFENQLHGRNHGKLAVVVVELLQRVRLRG